MAFLLRTLIRLYRSLFSPLLHALSGGSASGCGCRFHPSCSAYALEAIETHGALRGTCYALYRLSKCHPWSSRHGFDPVPTALPKTSNPLHSPTPIL